MSRPKNKLDQWLESFDDFRVEFLRFAHLVCGVCGYTYKFDQEALKIAHASWRSNCEVWEKTYVMPDSKGLSHLKILSLLLWDLSRVEWMTALFNANLQFRELEFGGTTVEREEVRHDINAGRGTYIAFQFVIKTLNAFETGRTDRVQEFEFRLTNDLMHDIMVYLLSERRDDMAIFLILKALYVRDPR